MKSRTLTGSSRQQDGTACIENGFNFSAFYEVFASIVAGKNLTWRLVALDTGIPTATLKRMARGGCPDAGTLAVLSAWSGLNPADFVAIPQDWTKSDTLAQISTILESDPDLELSSIQDLETIIHVTYSRFKLQHFQLENTPARWGDG